MSSRGARAAIYASVLLYTAAASALHLLVPAYLSRGLHLGPAAIGAVVGVFGLASLAARLPVGAIYTDRRSGLLIVVGGGISAGAFVLVPLVGIASGYCFAGNAALLGCCDVVIATEDSSIGMGGPAMIEGGGLGVFEPAAVGPIDVQYAGSRVPTAMLVVMNRRGVTRRT